MSTETQLAPQHGRDCDPGCGCRDPKRAIPPTHVILQRLDVEEMARVLQAASPVHPRDDEWDDLSDVGKGYWRQKASGLRAHILGGAA